MHQNHFWNLMARHLSGNASAEEAAELEALLKKHPELSFAAQHVTDLWNLRGGYDLAEAEKAFKNHMQAIPTEEPDPLPSAALQRKNFRGVKKIPFLFTAIALFLLSGGWFLWNGGKKMNKPSLLPKAEVSTRPGSRTKLVLPDSTVVWLNSDSKLTYDPDFGGTNRNTILVGEAFFDVKKSSLPFIIQANDIRIKVLGTAFNVKCYANEKTTETSVIRGRVEISMNKRPGEPFVLQPNEKLIVANEPDERKTEEHKKNPLFVLKEITHIADSTILETSWVENKLVFADESFENIARKMERWYGVTIVFKNEKIRGERLTGVFEKESIRQALQALQLTATFHFSVNDNTVTIIH